MVCVTECVPTRGRRVPVFLILLTRVPASLILLRRVEFCVFVAAGVLRVLLHRTRTFFKKNYDAYLMASNTAHLMWRVYSALAGLTQANVLNMVQQVAQVTKKAVSAVPNGKVFILSTDRSWDHKLYSKAFADLGIPYIDFRDAAEGSLLSVSAFQCRSYS